MSTTPDEQLLGRRTVIKGLGAAAASSVAFGGTAMAGSGFPPNNERAATTTAIGESDGGVWTFLTTNKKGKPMFMGIGMSEGAFAGLTASPAPTHYHLDLPSASDLNFTFAGIDWNPQGHPPENVWTVPHFDFHFYLMDEEDVEDIPFGVPTYSIPADQVPSGYVTEDVLGAPSRTVIPEMGEHLIDPANPAPPYTFIYGAYDPQIATDPAPGPLLGYVNFATGDEYPPTVDPVPEGAVPLYLLTSGDGVGEITFLEPMVTAQYLSGLKASGGEITQSIPTPEKYAVAGYYPTAYSIRYFGKEKAYLIVLEDWEWFDAA